MVQTPLSYSNDVVICKLDTFDQNKVRNQIY